jgi:hypothetical protein
VDYASFPLFQKQLNAKFDVILIEPPLEEYSRSYGVTNIKFWDWDKATKPNFSLRRDQF